MQKRCGGPTGKKELNHMVFSKTYEVLEEKVEKCGREGEV
jgi:hypothetical protein